MLLIIVIYSLWLWRLVTESCQSRWSLLLKSPPPLAYVGLFKHVIHTISISFIYLQHIQSKIKTVKVLLGLHNENVMYKLQSNRSEAPFPQMFNNGPHNVPPIERITRIYARYKCLTNTSYIYIIRSCSTNSHCVVTNAHITVNCLEGMWELMESSVDVSRV